MERFRKDAHVKVTGGKGSDRMPMLKETGGKGSGRMPILRKLVVKVQVECTHFSSCGK